MSKGTVQLFSCENSSTSLEEKESSSSQVHEEFRYTETLIGHNIRLLYLDDRSKTDELRFSMKTTPLKNTQNGFKYNALSYAWGDPNLKKTILCDGQKLQIGGSLYSALWQLREEGLFHLPLWVDAVCINQQNIHEKNEQLRIMKEVYRSADLVIGWIGLEEEHDEVGFTLIKKIHKSLGCDNRNKSTMLDPEQLAQNDNHDQLELPDSMDPQWEAVRSILKRPYFFRVWIIQEVIVAQRCIIKSGKLSIDREELFGFEDLSERFERIRDAMLGTMLEANEQDSPNLSLEAVKNAIKTDPVPSIFELKRSFYSPIRTLWEIYMGYIESGGRGVAISSLLGATSGFEATVRKDKIFALVGLSSDVLPNFIDYTKTLKQLHIDIATIGMRNPGSWGPLLFSLTQSMGRSTDLPSWVPYYINCVSYSSLISFYSDEGPFNGKVTWCITSSNVSLTFHCRNH
jgi:hypothetical protein